MINFLRRLFCRKKSNQLEPVQTPKFELKQEYLFIKPKLILINYDIIRDKFDELMLLFKLNKEHNFMPETVNAVMNEEKDNELTNVDGTNGLMLNLKNYINLTDIYNSIQDYFDRNTALKNIFRSIKLSAYNYVIVLSGIKLPEFVEYYIDFKINVNDLESNVVYRKCYR